MTERAWPRSASSCAVKYHAEFNERAGRIFLCHRDSAPTGVGDPPERLLYQRFSCAIWIRLPQVSFTMAMVEPVTFVGGIVNSAPAAFIRS